MGSQPHDQLTRRLLSGLHYLLLVGGAGALLATAGPQNPLLVTAGLLLGWVAGSLIEYLVHRFVLHGPAFAARVHARHHKAPGQEQIDPMSYLTPLVIALLLWAGLHLLVGVVFANGMLAGLCLQYSWFRAEHRLMHTPGHELATGEKARFHRGHHQNTGCNFGVTTPVWDRLFGSRYEPVRTTDPGRR